MRRYSIKTAVFYWLYVKYLQKMNDANNLNECKSYFRQAVEEAADRCKGTMTDSMRYIMMNISAETDKDKLLAYARNMVKKNYAQLVKAGVASD